MIARVVSALRRVAGLEEATPKAAPLPTTDFEKRMRQSRQASLQRERARERARQRTGNLLEHSVLGGPYRRDER